MHRTAIRDWWPRGAQPRRCSSGGFLGSWVLLSRLPGLSAGLSLGSAVVAACKKKTWALAQIRCARAVVGHRGSLLPRHFGTSESRATGRISRLESVLVVHRAVGRKFPLGALQEQPPAERPDAEVGSLGVRNPAHLRKHSKNHKALNADPSRAKNIGACEKGERGEVWGGSRGSRAHQRKHGRSHKPMTKVPRSFPASPNATATAAALATSSSAGYE